jgi:hypothetical protein
VARRVSGDVHSARIRSAPSCREVPNAHTALSYELAEAESRRVGVELQPSHSHRYDQHRLDREWRSFEVADALLVPSEFLAPSFLGRGTAPDRLAYHRYGCDTSAFTPDLRADRVDRPFTACFSGSGEPRKGCTTPCRHGETPNSPLAVPVSSRRVDDSGV